MLELQYDVIQWITRVLKNYKTGEAWDIKVCFSKEKFKLESTEHNREFFNGDTDIIVTRKYYNMDRNTQGIVKVIENKSMQDKTVYFIIDLD
jgi:hypothetical protein